MVIALTGGAGVVAGELPFDIDDWHASLRRASEDEERKGLELGLYPGVSGVLGAPNLLSHQVSAYLSVATGRTFSVFVGYGREYGSPADADIFTVGLGGVRRLAAAAPQRGFHGKFLRYRRWTNRHHGVHDGVSVGTETGVGLLSVTFELGAARSSRNHWMGTAHVAIKVALPVLLRLGPSTAESG